MICPYCGALVPEGVKVCPSCGNVVDTEATGSTKIVSGETVISEGKTIIYTSGELDKTKIVSPELEPFLGWLVIIEGGEKWKDYKVPGKDCQLIIGSGNDVDIHIKGEGIEKRHASLRVRENKVTITDLDTEAGTYVNGECVVKKELEDGSLIKIGNVVLKFRRL
ncbi:MAG: FHA domain-containing protein [Hydrogenobacter sp.]